MPYQHTLGHLSCPACERAKAEAMHTGSFGTYLFPQAAAVWLDAKRATISPGMVKDYENCIKALTRFFGELRLDAIHIGHVNEYQRTRAVGPSRLNKELVTLGQILDVASLWTPIKRFYRPLALPESIGQALEPAEEDYLFQLARRRPRWLVAYCASIITNATTAGPGEILGLQLRDVDLQHGLIHVRRHVKNKYRIRSLPLNPDARWAIEQLLARARELGALTPEHYLLPHRAEHAGGRADPTRPMSGWKKAWAGLRAAAAKRYPHLAELRRYDLRHNAITKLLEDPAISERTVEEMAGHKLNSKIKDRYSHIRLERKREAAASLQSGHAPTPPKRPSGKIVSIEENWSRR